MVADRDDTERGEWPVLGRFWTIPNILTMSRLVLAAIVTYLILTDGPLVWLFVLLGVAMATDWFDGKIARWSHTVSEWGKVLDPMVDKFAAGAVILALTVKGQLPLWFLGLVAGRDLLILLGGVVLARRTGRIAVSIWSGKVAVTAVAITVLAALLRADPPVLNFCIWTSAVLLVYSYLRYLVRFFRFLSYGRPPHIDHEEEVLVEGSAEAS
ncbi:MAG: CDP-alcohol phosphatidyltransferase family protein [Rhodothermales bacterium]|nr:CDP-alcohol phosphatidyltransferase family protein [Rhodothermales bacterium]